MPYCDHYNIHNRWVVTNTGGEGAATTVAITFAITWCRSSWLKSQISSVAITQGVKGFSKWRAEALPVVHEVRPATCPPRGPWS